MKNIVDRKSVQTTMRGSVRGFWVNPLTGESILAFDHRNQLSYGCSDILARLLGGDVNYAPKYIGFIYGNSDNPTPVGLTDPTAREQTWSDLASNMAEITGNIQIAPLTRTPSITVDGDVELYTGNAVSFSGYTRSGLAGTYGFTTSAPYADLLEDNSYLYHAMLITKVVDRGTVYIPVARVTLATGGGAFLPKPESYELALEWQVSFF